jgi:putative transposase
MNPPRWEDLDDIHFLIAAQMEVDHRGLKRAQVRKAVSILGHWLLALRALLRLEVDRWRTGGSRDEAQAAILREAIRRYRAHPHYVLQLTA